LGQFNESVQRLVQRVSPSVVQVMVTSYAPIEHAHPSDADVLGGRQRSIGSGVIIDPDGYIVTNAHVVSGARQISIVLSVPEASDGTIRKGAHARGRTIEARVVGTSPELDLALLKVDDANLPTLAFANADRIGQGQLVFAFGS